MEQNSKKIVIIGSGPAGCFLAILLAKKGYKVDIYEKLSKQEINIEISKRSYNITIYNYAKGLLIEAGLWEQLQPYFFNLKGTVTHLANTAESVITLINQNKIDYLTITRANFTNILLQEATKQKLITLHYDSSLVAIKRQKKELLLQNSKTKKTTIAYFDVLFGADGINSLVRSLLQQGQEIQHSQKQEEWCYRQFKISSKMVERLKLEKQFEHTWTQKNTFIISHPQKDYSLSALIVFQKTDKQNAFFATETDIELFFTKHFPQLKPALSEIVQSLLSSPDGSFSTIHTRPWYYKDCITIVGDAAHGFYPFFGQGTSAALGDSMCLIKLLDKYGTDWGKIFPLYQKARKRHMDTLGNLSKEVMQKYLRYKRADYTAIYDKLYGVLYHFFPTIFYPPLFFSLTTDPAHADDHNKNFLRQHKIIHRFGFSLLVTVLTKIFLFYEIVKKQKIFA
ncbi:MAG TPA: NAD(P)/FAD-dependent oxidoreductase [Candidatus Sulfotelmatobacter sp.]|jgi:kynurenine 3-monooxygenase|nr:NAD(P)/FAD-dependent oxidoreductase [Candidatus Sulfotelmatobacter sp.]